MSLLSSLNPKSKDTTIDKQATKKLKIIIQSLLDHSDSHDFREPVDWKNLGLTDYPQVVKHPMDLNTVNKKFSSKEFKTVEKACDTIQLIWDNCKAYNPPNSWIYETAEKLERAFKKMAKNYFPDLGVEVPIKTQQQKKTQQMSMIDEEYYSDITYHDKLRFSEALSFLSSKDLEKVVKQVRKKCPEAYRQSSQEKDRCQLLIDNMELSLFNEIFSSIREINAKNSPNPSGSNHQNGVGSEARPQKPVANSNAEVRNSQSHMGAPSKKIKTN